MIRRRVKLGLMVALLLLWAITWLCPVIAWDLYGIQDAIRGRLLFLPDHPQFNDHLQFNLIPPFISWLWLFAGPLFVPYSISERPPLSLLMAMSVGTSGAVCVSVALLAPSISALKIGYLLMVLFSVVSGSVYMVLSHKVTISQLLRWRVPCEGINNKQ